jgi:DNA primase
MDNHRRNARTLAELVKARIDYASFFLRYFPHAKVASSRIVTLCPIPSHGHSGKGQPCLSIDLSRGLFHCFSRNEGGDIFRFYELMNNVSFGDGVRAIALEFGLESVAPRATLKAGRRDSQSRANDMQSLVSADEMAEVCGALLEFCAMEEQAEGIEYLGSRGISSAVIENCGVRYFPQNAYSRVMAKMLKAFNREKLEASGLFNASGRLTFYRHRLLFPFFVEGRVSYLQARAIDSGVEPRWHNMRGTISSLYNLDRLTKLPSGSTVYLVEGFTDTLTLLSHNFDAVGLVGAAGFKEEWICLLGRFNVVAALDSDEAGDCAAAKYESMFEERGLKLWRLRLPVDINDYFMRNPAAPLEVALLTEAVMDGL